MNKAPLLFISLVLAVIISCNSREKKERNDSSAVKADGPVPVNYLFDSLPGSVFYIGQMDTSNCRVSYGVDSGVMLAFIDDSTVVRSGDFMSDRDIFTGHYRVESDTLVIRYDSTYASRQCGDQKNGNTVTIGGDVKNKILTRQLSPVKIVVRKCSSGRRYLSTAKKKSDYLDQSEGDAVRDSTGAGEIIKKLEADSLWQLLFPGK
ncbi:MAG TPA: hypothetical protein VFU15_16015 [Bacteroidia bacterium]|nr:hypothetical protein [Bacteroidia bacterium]